MKCSFLLASLSIAWLLNSSAVAGTSANEFQASVVNGGFIWSHPGVTWYDCKNRLNEPKIKKICESGKLLKLESGDDVDLVLNRRHEPEIKTLSVTIAGHKEKKRYYHVRDPGSGKKGWMSSDYISNPRPKEFEDTVPAPVARKLPDPCVTKPADSRAHTENLRKDAADIGAATSKLAMGATKSEREMDHFACLYREGHVSKNELKTILPGVKRTALAAEKAFGIPSTVLRCAMLIESGFRGAAVSDMNAYGYAQVISETVRQLHDTSEQEPYKSMWDKYKKLEPAAVISEETVRTHSTVISSMGTMALYLKYLMNTYVSKNCTDCQTSDGQFSRKELYLLIAGYNGGQKQLILSAKRNPSQMLSGYPPPDETRKFLVKLDNCLHAGTEKTFAQSKKDAAKNNHLKAQIEHINGLQRRRREQGASDSQATQKLTQKENSLKEKITKQVTRNAGYEYEFREKECNEAFPL
jgi:hypothetical protein